jgi:hypothetical protein
MNGPTEPQLPGTIGGARSTGRDPMLPLTSGPLSLMSATTARERMERLCAFIEFWLGPRRPEYGEDPAALASAELPEPLRILLAFAGRWPGRGGTAPGCVAAISTQDSLLSLDRMELTADGKLLFLTENQGVWRCLTSPVGDDPSVWCVGDAFYSEDESLDGVGLVCQSLSRFLVTFTLQELMFGSTKCIVDERIDELYRASGGGIPLWLDGRFVDPDLHSFHYWNGLLVGDLYHRCFAANCPDAIEFLEANQSPVSELTIYTGHNLPRGPEIGLTIRRDGSCKLFGGEFRSMELPPSTFDFPLTCESLLKAVTTEGLYPSVCFERQGQQSTCIRRLPDTAILAGILRRAAARLTDLPEPIRRVLERYGIRPSDRG